MDILIIVYGKNVLFNYNIYNLYKTLISVLVLYFLSMFINYNILMIKLIINTISQS